MLHLAVLEDEAGGAWHLRASVDACRAETERVPLEEVQALTAEIEALLAPPLVTFSGLLAAREAAEREVGRLLGELCGRGRLGGVFAEARVGRRPISVLVSVDGQASARLPWELLSWPTDGRSVEDAGEGLVVRLGRGRPRQEALTGDDVRVLCWSPTPDDEACATAIRALEDELRGALLLLKDLAEPPAPVPGRVDLLVVVAHGRAEGGFGALLCGEAERDMAELASLLGPIQRQGLGVILQVCDGGSFEIGALRGLADALLRAGGGFCVAPRGRLDVRASVAFTAAVVQALRRGRSLPAAFIAGRTAIRALGGTHPDERPSRVLVFVADGDALADEPPIAVPELPGWGRCAAELQLVARRAHRMARDRGLPWVGLEHLLGALSEGEGSPRARELARALRVAQAAAALQALGPYHVAASERSLPSPRLQALAARLPDGADLEDLWTLALADTTSGVHALTHLDLVELFHASPVETAQRRTPAAPRPATGFEVLWGPEDGRRFFPAPGQVIGRHRSGSAAAVQLYGAGVTWDRALSSTHLTYLGPGRVQTQHGLSRRHPGARVAELPRETGELAVAVGEVLILGDTTWLRAIDEKDAQLSEPRP